MTARIARITAFEALDSRGRPTVAARLELTDGTAATAHAPSGASAGSHEAKELRDGGTRRGGLGVLNAVDNVASRIAPALQGMVFDDPSTVDDALAELDGTDDFSNLGANATLAVSLATTLAVAASERTSVARWLQPEGDLLLPMPMVNIVSGGAHAGRSIDIQDVLVVPHGAKSFAEAIEWCADVRDAASAMAVDSGVPGASLVADEGGIGIPFASNADALRFVVEAIERSGHQPGEEVSLAIDVAATQFFADGHYRLDSENRALSASELIDELARWIDDYPVISIEDALAEDEWRDWVTATRLLGSRIQLIGDDHFVTNGDRLARGVAEGSANSILVKVNQNGLVSRSRAVLDTARASGYSTVVSARSGETEQSWLADFAVGWRAGQIKVGSTHRSERGAKWNRLLELEATESTVFASTQQQHGLPVGSLAAAPAPTR
ncbi:phosphopyruvate hydratase [Diaminobutyricibacter sp. McL0608]|uniref:phosphopyruvate hydratase n=1 Tax=Leifsonia sp. McL0608 TaxID=3143537 RepID=UPI0031F2E0DB